MPPGRATPVDRLARKNASLLRGIDCRAVAGARLRGPVPDKFRRRGIARVHLSARSRLPTVNHAREMGAEGPLRRRAPEYPDGKSAFRHRQFVDSGERVGMLEPVEHAPLVGGR